ncbi:MAG: tRNA guanosine(34) transglycosylase Tgt [Phycisphaerae bacterium]|jgi:queuine tRNA-ribosyltransferase|nr:tRNA guanosine(34) transglycosylase Tgt [Phycisphaerae bacterium]
MVSLEIQHTDGKARAGVLSTPHGQVQTPVFMPVGTAGTVKGVTPEQLTAAGSQMILANTYHMMLRPGGDTVAKLGGLHAMMGWSGPILTDSGGFQVFSLAHLRRIDDEKVVFQSHVDGSLEELTPRRCIEIQRRLGADVIMQLDECPPGDASAEQVARAVDRSILWARECRGAWREDAESAQALFGIQQGGVFEDLRARSAAALVELDLPGYAIGGLSVGEGHHAMARVLDATDSQLPADRPRYLMGVGEPRDILAAVRRGIDMFDCVLPTRNARNAFAFTWGGSLRMRNAKWTTDPAPLDANCNCYTCGNFSRGTIRHLFMAKEMLGPTLVTIHNLHFFAEFMAAIRNAITAGTLETDARRWISRMYPPTREPGDEN